MVSIPEVNKDDVEEDYEDEIKDDTKTGEWDVGCYIKRSSNRPRWCKCGTKCDCKCDCMDEYSRRFERGEDDDDLYEPLEPYEDRIILQPEHPQYRIGFWKGTTLVLHCLSISSSEYAESEAGKGKDKNVENGFVW